MHDEKERATAVLTRIGASGDRRSFLRVAGVSSLALLLPAVMSECASDSLLKPKTTGSTTTADGNSATTVVLDFSSDVGVLNYAYALEQLEAAFYTQVISSSSALFPPPELRLMTDVRDHEITHRNFFKAALAGNAIPALTVDFSSIDFGSRSAVLAVARTFEDLGVAAYNGAAKYLASPTNLLVAGKIVSVEARHASAIRDLIQPRSRAFAGDDVVNPTTGLDREFEPPQVLAAADPFIVNTITVTGL